MTGDSATWPSDEMFREAWSEKHVYQTLNNQKIVHILRRLSDSFLGTKSEKLSIESQLTVEHILPQKWIENWPLEDGSKGMLHDEWWDAEPEDPRKIATSRRNALLHTFGNLTILTKPLNSAVSNSAWTTKKPELLKSSLLPINQYLYDFRVWDETAIVNRGKELFSRALLIWPAPGL
ncbi:MAG: HNH endonuclease family protein [Desulfobacca sp.]|nr:HNH endonuclease family protein [Desulfobacca sp.]